MAELTIKKKKELVYFLYMNTNLNNKEIAAKVDVNNCTVGKWIKEGNWENMRAAYTVTNEQNISRMREQINQILKTISEREEGKRVATKQEADTLKSLGSAIQKLEREVGLTDIINVGTKFITWLRKYDIERAKEFVEFWDLFIKEQTK